MAFTTGIDQSSTGPLVYQESWSKHGKFKDVSELVSSISMFAAVVILGPVFILFFIPHMLNESCLVLATLPVSYFLILLMSYAYVDRQLRIMPFKIYINGFTLPEVGLAEGWRRDEVFISWQRLDRVALSRQMIAGMKSPSLGILLHYDGKKKILLDHEVVSDPFGIIKALMALVPEKIDGKLKDFVESVLERKISTGPAPRILYAPIVGMFFGMMIFFMIITGFFLEGVFLHRIPTIIAFILPPLTLGGGFLIFSMGFKADMVAQKAIIRDSSLAAKDGIDIAKRTALGRIVRFQRLSIPYVEVKSIRLKLEPFSYLLEAELEASNGEILRVPSTIYDKISSFSNFSRYDHMLVNTSPVKSGGPIFKTNRAGAAGLFIVLVSTTLIGMLIW